MSVQKDPLSFEEDEEFGAEDEFDGNESQESFSCKYCEFNTTNVDDLDEHIITHVEAIIEDNGEQNDTKSDLHLPEDALEDFEMENSMSPTVSSDPEERSIPDKEFTIDNTPLEKRTRQRLPAFYEECANKKNKKVFVCPFCGYQSMKKLDMNKHLKEHRVPVEIPVYACAECSYTTRRKCDMPKHLLTHCENGTVPMYQCDECPYATKRKGDLSKHMLCHSKPTSSMYSCSECPYSSKRHGDLKKHLICHENEAGWPKQSFVYNCTECGYTSKRLNDLHKHAALHCDRTVKGVFKCPKCDYASAAGSPFAKHILSQCQYTEMALPVFPKDSSMQEYIVLEEEELHLYQLDKDNITSVEASENVNNVLRGNRKRRTPNKNSYTKTKKGNLSSFYVNVESDLEEECELDESSKETETTKVIVIPEFVENEQNTESQE